MKKTILIISLCLLVLTTGAWAATPATTWEYKTVTGKAYDERKLNALGAEGWELASCASGLDACIFKRQR